MPRCSHVALVLGAAVTACARGAVRTQLHISGEPEVQRGWFGASPAPLLADVDGRLDLTSGDPVPVLLGEAIRVETSWRSVRSGVFPVTSDSEQVTYEALDGVEVTCTSPSRAPCAVSGTTVTPGQVGTYEVSVESRYGLKTSSERWTIAVEKMQRLELAPCGTVHAGTDGGATLYPQVYAVGSTRRFPLKVPISVNGQPQASPMQGIWRGAPGQFDLKAEARGFSAACTLSIVPPA